MEARDLYKEKFEAQIHEWSAKLDVLQARSEAMTAQAKLDVKPHLDAVQARLEAAKGKLATIAPATDDRWDDVTKEVESAWTDFKAAAGGAYDAMKRHKTEAA